MNWRRYAGCYCLLLTAVCGVGQAKYVSNWDVEGAHGQLDVRGILTESACRLDMESVWQEVNMGYQGLERLQHVGDLGNPVEVKLKLQDCLRTTVGSSDIRTGNKVWSLNQPDVSVSFVAIPDENVPSLIKVSGVTGVALRITDKLKQDVPLGSQGKALLLNPGQNVLTYYITPQRTAAPIASGAYQANINFRLNYD